MGEHGYEDFRSRLNGPGVAVLDGVNEHIALHYPDDTPMLQGGGELHYRIKPKTGRALCVMSDHEGGLRIRFCCLTTMAHELLLRIDGFSAEAQKRMLSQCVCCVSAACRGYGGGKVCQWRQHFWVRGRVIMTCPYPWVTFEDVTAGDLADLTRFIDMQARHPRQDARDVKGGSYAEVNARRCGQVRVINLERLRLDIDTFQIGDHAAKPARLEKYAALYHLIPMGEYEGLWYCLGGPCGGEAYAVNEIGQGQYASATIEDPMTFSACRAWNYLCKWILDSGRKIRGGATEEDSAPCFVRFFMDGGQEHMQMAVPVE